MPCCDINAAYSYDYTKNLANENCHSYLKENYRICTPAQSNVENCNQNRQPCNSCDPAKQKCWDAYHHYENSKNIKITDENNHLLQVAHSCPVGKIVRFTDSVSNDYKYDKDIIKGKDISHIKEDVSKRIQHQKPVPDEFPAPRERLCCAEPGSWTEPRLCRCDPCDPCGFPKRCGCECGAAIISEPQKEKPKKAVRFADEAVKPEERDTVFRNIDIHDVKKLCNCCRECADLGQDRCVGKPVLVYEVPEAKLEDTSVTKKDYCWQKLPPREMPPWHPNRKDRWHHIDVPSLCETTYQCDFKPPVVLQAERNPVYLAPQKEKIDPCQQLAEDYITWKKTSTGEKHTYHSSCNECDKDLHRVHLHQCNVAHLPPQFQCHGDGHLCQPSCEGAGDKFTICDKRDTGGSRYWWQRTCCVPEKKDVEKLDECPSAMIKPECPSYTTTYTHDFRNPNKPHRENLYLGNCKACDFCTERLYQEQPNLLCTKDTRQHLMTQKAGII